MRNFNFIFLFFIGFSFTFAQNGRVEIADLPPKSENFNFPVITFKEKPLVEKKINTFLQVSELEFILDSGKNPFQLASTATNSYQNYLYFYEWKKLETPANILGIEMQGEASGAYPEGFTNYKNFDLRTGNYINLADLFQQEFQHVIEKIINEKVEKRVNDYLAELKSLKEKSEDTDDQIRMYEDCFTNHSLDYIEFYFGKTELKLLRVVVRIMP